MKAKKGMQALSLLMILVLSVAVIVPIVSAVDPTIPNVPEEKKYNETASMVEESSTDLPDFQPNIMDKLSYEEEKECMKTLTPTPPLPESEIAQLIVSEAWLLQNDEDKRSEIVRITIPESWLKDSPVNEKEAIVLLRVPKKMLKLDNKNANPNEITLSYPIEMFKFYSNIDEMEMDRNCKDNEISSMNDQLSTSMSGTSNLYNLKSGNTKDINRYARAWYYGNRSFNVVTVTGSIDPTSYSNQGETFRNYNEREIYLDRDGDIIEFISDFTDSGNSYVWTAIYDEDSWVTPWNWLLVNVTGTLQQIEYRLYMDDGYYDLWLRDTSTDTWYQNSYNDRDNPATRVNWLVGSTEVDTVGSISEYFKTETNPIRDDWTYANGDWHSPQITFNWNGYDPADDQYVYIRAWWDGSGRINTRHIAGSDY